MTTRRRLPPRVAASAASLGSTLALSFAPAYAQEETPPIPSIAELQTLAAGLDDAFEARSTERFLERFDTIHVGHRESVRGRLEELFRYGIDCTRESEILDHWRVGEHAVAHVRSVVRATDFIGDPAIEHYLLASRRSGPDRDSAPQITLLLEIADELLPGFSRSTGPGEERSRFRCEVCNFYVESGDNWLAAPDCNDRWGGVEALSFHSLDQDVKIYVSVHLDDRVLDPRDQLARLDHLSHRPRVVDWRPESFDDPGTPSELTSARAQFSIDESKRRCEVYYIGYGRVGYLLEVEGAAAAVDKQMGEVEHLLSSFRLVNPELAPDEVAERILAHRRAGSVNSENRYRNESLSVELQGPTDWIAELETGGVIFDLRFRHPEAERFVSARGLAPQRGRERWTVDLADSMTAEWLRERQIELIDRTGWIERDRAMIRDCRLETADGDAVVLRLAVRDDLLIVLEGRSEDPNGIAELLAIFESLDC